MSDQNNSAAPQGTPGSAPGSQTPGNNQAVNNQAPGTNAPAPNTDPGVNNANDGQKAEVSLKELNELKRKAGRWDAQTKNDRTTRRDNRRQRSSNSDTDGDPDLSESIRERDARITSLSSENLELKAKDKVRELFEGDEYKYVPDALKKAIVRNPLGFSLKTSETVEDITADIQDYLDDTLDRMAGGQPAQPGNQPANNAAPVNNQNGTGNDGQRPYTPSSQPARQTPPAAGSGPSSPNASLEADIAGKTGPARSTTILSNLLKGRK